jgi:hypothetical protein
LNKFDIQFKWKLCRKIEGHDSDHGSRIIEINNQGDRRLLAIDPQNIASLTPNKWNQPSAPANNLTIGDGEANGATTSLPPQLIEPQTPQNLNKTPDPIAIDNFPRHHRQLINSNDNQRLQSNHPPIQPIDHSSRQNHNPLVTPNSIAPLRKHRQLTGKGFNVPKASPPHNRRTAPLRAKIREGKVLDRFAGLHDQSCTELCDLVAIAQVVIGDIWD